jgi:crotonobetainyl-CoA:carnitine CoA-transferase CaiB-like acyl-CoA transferase
MPVLRLGDLKDDPHVVAVGLMETAEHPTEGTYRQVRSPLRFSATPYVLRRHAPRVGEHTREVLLEAGLSGQEVDALVASAAAASGDSEP